MTTKFIVSLLAVVLLATIWLGFAYLMRDSAFVADILGWGLVGFLLTAYWLLMGAVER